VEVALAQYPPLGVSGPEGDELRSAAQLDQIPPSRQLPALLDGAPGGGWRERTARWLRRPLRDAAQLTASSLEGLERLRREPNLGHLDRLHIIHRDAKSGNRPHLRVVVAWLLDRDHGAASVLVVD